MLPAMGMIQRLKEYESNIEKLTKEEETVMYEDDRDTN